MSIAIVTKYLCPTNFRDSRVSARTCNGHSIVVPWSDCMDLDENHVHAARELVAKHGLCGRWVGGHTDTGMVFVRDFGDDSPTTFLVQGE